MSGFPRGGGGGGGGGLAPFSLTSAGTSPSGSALVLCNSADGPFSGSLPTLGAADIAEQVWILDAGVNVVTIDGPINGGTAPGILTSVGDRYRFLWDGGSATWWVAELSLAPWLITTSLTWATPAGVNYVRALPKGGGGGGGGAGSMNSATNPTPGTSGQGGGGGGGCGGWQDQVVPVTPGTGEAITIGAGGTGGAGGAAAASGGTGNAGAAGTAGGYTTGLGLTAPGGGPGSPSAAQSLTTAKGGAPGDPNNFVANPQSNGLAFLGWGNAAPGGAGSGLPPQELYGGGCAIQLGTATLGSSGGPGVLLGIPPLFNGGLYVYRGNPTYSAVSTTVNGQPGQTATQYGCGGGGGGGGAPGGAGGAGGNGAPGSYLIEAVT